jgi:Flp pilus assembly protein TadD
MSIVTDTLNRLQNQSSQANAGQEEPGTSRPSWYETHTAQVDRPPLSKSSARLMAGYLLLGIGCLAVGAFYFEENRVPDLSRQAPTSVQAAPNPLAIISSDTSVPDAAPPDATSNSPYVDNQLMILQSPSRPVIPDHQAPSNRVVPPKRISRASRSSHKPSRTSSLARKHLPSGLRASVSEHLSRASLNQRTAESRAVASPSSPNAPSFTAGALLSEAQEFIRHGQYGDAITRLLPLFHKPPVDWEPWFWLGTAYLGNGELEQADRHFLEGLARNTKIPHLWMQRALVAQQSGDYPLAVYLLLQADSLQHDLPQIHLNLGYSFEQLGNRRLADLHYGKFLRLSDEHPDFFSVRTKLLSRSPQHRSEDAESGSPP